MSKKILAVSIVIVVVVSLVALTGTSAAQGPGGRGRGNNTDARGGGNGLQLQDGTGSGAGQQNGYGYSNQNQAQNQSAYREHLLLILPPATPGDLPDDVIAAITAGIQDEYNAYATYQAIIDQFGAVRPFTNILQAEDNHITALSVIFERYGLPVPAPQPLDQLPAFATLSDACVAAASAEIANFDLYDQWLVTVQDYPDIAYVFQMLRDASEYQHLPAFERCAS